MLVNAGGGQVGGNGTARRDEGHRIAPEARAFGAAVVHHLHLIAGVGYQVNERIGREHVFHQYPFIAHNFELQVVGFALAGPIQSDGVGRDAHHGQVVSSLTADFRENVRFVAPVAPRSAAVGANHHGVFRLGGQIVEDERIDSDTDEIIFIVVDHHLPFRSGAILNPAQHGSVLGGVGDGELRGSRTGQRGEGHQVAPVAQPVGAAVVLHLHLIIGVGCQLLERVG